MGNQFDGKAALITGGGSGIGLACARALLADGATVTIMGRSKERLDRAIEELGHDRVQAVTGDVANEDDVQAAVEAATQPAGGLHACIAAAGTGGAAPIVVTDVSEWQRIL